MAIYLVGYDLRHKHLTDYKELIKAIKQIAPNYWHCLDSTWLIEHSGPAPAIRDALVPHMHNTNEPQGDKLLVAQMAKGAAWTKSFSEDCQGWLRKHL